MLRLLATLFASLSLSVRAQSTVPVDWRGVTFAREVDTLPDFSFAGAYASSEALPSAMQEATITLEPKDILVDRTDEIQNAIDQLSSQGGGIVELSAGNFNISSEPIFLRGSGVTLRGALPAAAGSASPTIVYVSGATRKPFHIGERDQSGAVYDESTSAQVTTPYVPAGAATFEVARAGQFNVGDLIEVRRVISEEWIAALEMDGLERDGSEQTWIEPGTLYTQRREIASISGQSITLNYPLTDPINESLNASATIVSYDLPSNYTRGCSLESMSIVLFEDQSGNPISGDNFGHALVFNSWSRDNWARQLSILGFVAGVHIQEDASRVTLQDVSMYRTQITDNSSGYPADFLIDGTQVLLHRCSTAGVPGSQTFTVATGAMVAGPVVVLEHATSNDRHMVEPHARWATGILIDNSLIGSLSLINRGTYGSGQGWACAFSLGWNVISYDEMSVESPPLSANLCVGCMGQINPDQANYTSFIEPQRRVTPMSLFRAQLSARLGGDAGDTLLRDPAIAAAENDPPVSSASASASASGSSLPPLIAPTGSTVGWAGPSHSPSASSHASSVVSTADPSSRAASVTEAASTVVSPTSVHAAPIVTPGDTLSSASSMGSSPPAAAPTSAPVPSTCSQASSRRRQRRDRMAHARLLRNGLVFDSAY